MKLIFQIILLLLPGLISAQIEKYFCSEAKAINKIIQRLHINPKSHGEKLNQKITDDFILRLDPKGQYLTVEDTEKISVILAGLTDKINSEICPDIDTLLHIYSKKVELSKLFIEEILTTPFKYSAKDTIKIFSRDAIQRESNDQGIKKRWIRILKYKTLLKMLEGVSGSNHEIDSALMREKEIRQVIFDEELCQANKLLRPQIGLKTHIANLLLESFANGVDPHTNYFTSDKRDEFKTSLSSQSFSFGFQISKNKHGDFVISQLVPGGPAWKSNELHKGDKIIELKPKGQTPMSLFCMGTFEVNRIINTLNINELVVSVIKKNGELRKVYLSKAQLEEELNTVQSYVLNGKDQNPKIGYITFPGFYTQWENQEGKSVANDVAKQILKLKQENVNGLIVDLRYNGGGSIQEAQSLAGIFIDYGALGMTRTRGEKPRLLRDFNRGTIYSGPLVIMTNLLSASASEFLAGTLQDYNRAVIVGSPTYGKATAQIIEPLHPDGSFNSYLKVTIGKLYRLNGNSHQCEGILPDIRLPDIYETFSEKEENHPCALAQDTVMKKPYYRPNLKLPIPELLDSNKVRMNRNNNFNAIATIAANENVINLFYRLEPISFCKDKNRIDAEYELLYDSMNKKTKTYTIEADQYMKEVVQLNDYKKKQLEIHINETLSDIYIEEAYNVIKNLIQINNR